MKTSLKSIGSKSSSNPQPSAAASPPPPRWLLPGFFDGVENDVVDTTLSLRPPGTTNWHCNNKSSSKPQPSAAATPPPRWLLPGFFDGVENDVVDTTLSLRPPSSKAVANNSPKVLPPSKPQPSTSTSASATPPPPPQWLLPGFFDGVENDVVDTTLSLRPPGTANCHCNNKSSSKPHPSAAATPPPRWLLPGFFDGVENDVVDTTLSLRPPSSKAVTNNSPKVSPPSNPQASTSAIPPRWLLLGFPNGVEDHAADTTLSLRPSKAATNNSPAVLPPTNISGSANNKSRKRSRDETDQNKKKRGWGRAEENEDDDEGEPSNIPMPAALARAVESRGGSLPAAFLCRKRLEESDVGRHQNRVFVRGWRIRRVMAFLREEEAAEVVGGGGRGKEMVGVDGGGNVYERLSMKKWASVDMIVINFSDWSKVVAKNNAEKGDFMEIWGYREKGKSCLAFNFWKPN